MLSNALLMLIFYLIGAIPFSVIVANFFKTDILNAGSGNPGTTNVIRNVGFLPGLLVFLLDFSKGLIPCYFLRLYYPNNHYLLAFACFIVVFGHMFSVFLKGKGGKGFATSLGLLFFISWEIAVILSILIIILIVITRYVSVATLTSMFFAPFLFFYFQINYAYIVATALIAVLVWFKHIANIKRLISGKENKLF